MGHHGTKHVKKHARKGCAFFAMLLAALSIALAAASLGLQPSSSDLKTAESWNWYKMGSTSALTGGVFVGTKVAVVCALTVCADVNLQSLNGNASQFNLDDFEKITEAGMIAYVSGIVGCILAAIFALWMLMAMFGSKHAHFHGRFCSILAASAFATAWIGWVATRPKWDKFVEGDAFYSMIAAMVLLIVAYIVSHFLAHGKHKGYTKI